jgi:hypothetical protein
MRKVKAVGERPLQPEVLPPARSSLDSCPG